MFIALTILSIFSGLLYPGPEIRNDRFEVFVENDHAWVVKETATGKEWKFRPDFVVITSEKDPGMAMRPAGIDNVMYNVVTWKNASGDAASVLHSDNAGSDVGGDGFDDRILKGNNRNRTANVFRSGNLTRQQAVGHKKEGSKIEFIFPGSGSYALSATLYFSNDTSFPVLQYSLKVSRKSFYSVGYVGAPKTPLEKISAIWQPMVWQEKRFPEESFLTLAYQCPVPSALACDDNGCVGVVADPKEFAFDPLPLLDNSRFGIALRTEDGMAQPMLFAPAPGGIGSEMDKGTSFTFRMQLYMGESGVTGSFEDIAREIYQFKDYRRNTSHTLNETLDNMLDYGMSEYSMFVDSLKGCAYSTDVPGAVKNVSSLNPLQMALLADREDIYQKRAYPIMEFLISREKFLFTLDSTQKIQNPSRKMNGPVAPISELTALYQVSGGKSKAFMDLAQQEYSNSRTRNLNVAERGDTWQNALAIYRATNEKLFLQKAMKGADEYLERRVKQPSDDFDNIEGGFFFWNGFTPDWINLFQLYEVTGDSKYLDAAQSGARQYTMFCWYSPEIPDDSILVNKGNKAPHYWYLKNKGHAVMRAPEEVVPAWQLSETGLTPESSGTCAGHRAIFMANYAPWMLRIGFLKNDEFLQQTARAAIIGRYANFPGYHINTARTTAYEKPGYPLRPFKELSVNSFHFNHIWPHMSILVDYLFTDAYVKSEGQISIPSTYIEGYAYLQSKFYGHEPGEFYGDKNVYPWMPAGLLATDSKQLNYVAFRRNDALYLAFLNQSDEKITSNVTLNTALFSKFAAFYDAKVWINNGAPGKRRFVNGKFGIEVAPHSISAVKIAGLSAPIKFQDRIFKSEERQTPGLISLEKVNGKAMILDFGKQLRTIYVYLRDDDQKVQKAVLEYTMNNKRVTLSDARYPFEFTIPFPEKSGKPKFVISVTDRKGKVTRENILFHQE